MLDSEIMNEKRTSNFSNPKQVKISSKNTLANSSNKNESRYSIQF